MYYVYVCIYITYTTFEETLSKHLHVPRSWPKSLPLLFSTSAEIHVLILEWMVIHNRRIDNDRYLMENGDMSTNLSI